MNKHRLWLLLIILIAFALRLTLLGEQSLWYDEGVTWWLSQMSLPELIQWTAADIQPPLYYCLIWSTSLIFGDSEWALRFPSTFFNILTIPLIYALTRRLFSPAPPHLRSVASLLTVILFALSPFVVYYSQEARMYTLLVFEATLASYLLLKTLHFPLPDSQLSIPYSPLRVPTPYSLFYVLTATTVLYTHYFAAFLLTAHALYAVLILWQRRWPKTLIVQALQMFGLIMLLFLPWLPTLLSRLGDDPSYWPGTLKLNEALRKVLISFTVGETVFEQTGWWLALGYLAVLIISVLWGLISRQINKSANQQIANNNQTSYSAFSLQPSAFLTLWFLLPPLLILTLSYQSPKFNPRYTMLAYPAFVLILATALTQLLKIPLTTRITHHTPETQDTLEGTGGASVSRITHTCTARRRKCHASRFLFTLSLLFILSTSTFSLYNWFTDPRFSKDDFKALAQFVRERQAADETVLLSSGHMFPVWAYYYGWENWTPLPQMERLDTSRVTDLSIADDIAQAIRGKGGVWLVSWQDEVIDPNGVVPFWLDQIGQRPVDAGDFWGVGLEHWRLTPTSIKSLHESPIEQPLPGSYNFANQVDLLGMTQLSDTEIALFWRARRPLSDDLTLTFDLTDKAGFDWDYKTFVGRPGAYFYPPSRWPVGQTVMTRHELPWQIGTPPGPYLVEIGLGQVRQSTDPDFIGWDVLDEQGRPQRQTVLLEGINLSRLVQAENTLLSLDAAEPLADFSPLVTVHRAILSPKTAELGGRILLKLWWQAGEANHNDISITFELVDAANQAFRVGSFPNPSRDFNLSRWQPGGVVLGQYWLDLPPNVTPGLAALQLQLINTTGHTDDKTIAIAPLEILPTERNFTPPPSVDVPFEANFSGQTTLLGADCSLWTGTNCHTAPGQSITLTLYWRADAPFDKNYTVFTHLLGPNETVLVNADHAPPKPTRGWVIGEIIADAVTLTLPADLPPGGYLLEVGLYDAANPVLKRLPLTTGETRVMLPQPLIVE